ncbi:hypothetical protein ACH4U3_18600 [Streptomyces griseoruber]|uniref:hypothetical protein n=1 Tax=Streptomyces griseoruber TaxID=1943 RepID=UPI0037AB4DB6
MTSGATNDPPGGEVPARLASRLPWEGGRPAGREAPVGLACHVLDDERGLTGRFRAV